MPKTGALTSAGTSRVVRGPPERLVRPKTEALTSGGSCRPCVETSRGSLDLPGEPMGGSRHNFYLHPAGGDSFDQVDIVNYDTRKGAAGGPSGLPL